MSQAEELSPRQLRKQVLIARVALQRVELGQEIALLKDRAHLPGLIGATWLRGKGASAWLGTAFRLARRLPITGTLLALVARRLPRMRSLLKWGGVLLALWPLVSLVRQLGARRRGPAPS